MVLIIQVGHHQDVALVYLDVRLPSTEPAGVSLLQHVLGNKTDKLWMVGGLSFFLWICRHHGNTLRKGWKMMTRWVLQLCLRNHRMS